MTDERLAIMTAAIRRPPGFRVRAWSDREWFVAWSGTPTAPINARRHATADAAFEAINRGEYDPPGSTPAA
jgi:hypothetical protein